MGEIGKLLLRVVGRCLKGIRGSTEAAKAGPNPGSVCFVSFFSSQFGDGAEGALNQEPIYPSPTFSLAWINASDIWSITDLHAQ